jgi:N-acetyl-anhydromuramyl-L-alanine amidase AmpD
MQIDTTSYNKVAAHPARWGYQARGNVAPSSIIIHTTNNSRKNTSFSGEAVFLRDSSAVSAHFLVGKDGRIVQFLDPIRWQAWHAGDALPAFSNAKSIGVEFHVSVGETWTAAQHEACTWLVRTLMAAHRIPPGLVDTHRAVAINPKGRKRDPEGWDDESFYAWRATLAPPVSLPTKRYRVKRRYVTQRKEDNGPPFVRELVSGEVVEVDAWYTNNRVHFASGEGFGDLADLEAI